MISNQERLDQFFLLLERARKIADKAMHVPGMQERMNHLANGFAVVAPCKNANSDLAFDLIFASLPNLDQGCLKVYPHFSEDKTIHERLNNPMFSPKEACHISNFHKIVINMNANETPACVAHYFLHELGHAFFGEKSGRNMANAPWTRDKWIAEEMENRTVDSYLLLALGGSPYQEEVRNGVYWITKLRTKKRPGVELGPTVKQAFSGKGRALDHVFGPPLSVNGKPERDSLFQLQCEMIAVDRSNMEPASKRHFKLHLIGLYYAQQPMEVTI